MNKIFLKYNILFLNSNFLTNYLIRSKCKAMEVKHKSLQQNKQKIYPLILFTQK